MGILGGGGEKGWNKIEGVGKLKKKKKWLGLGQLVGTRE